MNHVILCGTVAIISFWIMVIMNYIILNRTIVDINLFRVTVILNRPISCWSFKRMLFCFVVVIIKYYIIQYLTRFKF